jgi:hypothetical protein
MLLRTVHFIDLRRRRVLERENELRAARRAEAANHSRCVALVHVPGEGRDLLITERHTPERIRALRNLLSAFDDGYCTAKVLVLAYGRFHEIPQAERYTAMRDYCMQYTDDEILACRVAMSLRWPVWGGY